MVGLIRIVDRPAGLYVMNATAANLVMRGTSSVIGQALEKLEFKGATDATGADRLTFIASDLKCCGMGNVDNEVVVTLPIEISPVNDAPIVTQPDSITHVAEDTDVMVYTATGLSIADPDIGSSLFHVKLSTSQGLLTLGRQAGLTFTEGSGIADKHMAFRATINDANTALKVLRY